MKNRDRILDRLFQTAAGPAPPCEMPLAFDTRVLALVRASAPNGSAIIAVFAQRAAMIALAIMAVAAAGLYRTSASDNDLPTEYAMVDTAIQNNLGE